MKRNSFNIFQRISLLTLVLITIPAVLFMIITYLSSTHFYQSSTQIVNKDVAAHIATFTSPFELNKINREKADSVFYQAMVVSPGIEVYFLDSNGHVIAYHADSSTIKEWNIPLPPIQEFIHSAGRRYITSLDPRDPGEKKIFSAAAVRKNSRLLGYIYVILAGKEYRSTSQLLFGSHVARLALNGFLMVILLSALFTILYVRNLKRRFKFVTAIFDRFQKGDYAARFDTSKFRELLPVMQGFNHMAELLEESIGNLRSSESERKELVTRIAHDIRTPIATARGFTETLLFKQHSMVEEKEFLQLIFDKLNFIESLVQQLFELSKLESADFQPKKEPLVFSEILQENLHASKVLIAGKNISLRCVNCKDPVWVEGDVAMIESLIQNLLSNAIDNTPDYGSISIVLSLSGRDIQFVIENSGRPLSADLLHWLNQEDGNMTLGKRPSDSGVGLALIRKLISVHAFHLQVKSTNNSNSFQISMPVYERIKERED